MVLAHILLCVLLHTAVQASPVTQIHESPITLPIAARINVTGGASLPLSRPTEQDLQHCAQGIYPSTRLVGGGAARLEDNNAQVPVPVTNILFVYTCDVPIGNPPTSYKLLVDTGSSNTWIGAGKGYVRTATSKDLSQDVSVTYGSGSFTGREYSDTVQIGSAAIQGQSIGPVGLTQGTLSSSPHALIPTVTDNLRSQGFISSTNIGISFEPIMGNSPSMNGQLDFGGVDPSKFTGTINYAPVTTVEPAAPYWGVTQGITYGTSTILESTSAGIVDTGTTLLYLPSDAFSAYREATGGVLDEATSLLKLTKAQFERLESLHFIINGVSYEFTANAQIWPRDLNLIINGEEDAAYLIVVDGNVWSGSGLDLHQWLYVDRYYTVYDTDTRSVGFATTPNTYSTTN